MSVGADVMGNQSTPMQMMQATAAMQNIVRKFPKHNDGSLLALADLPFAFLPLLVGAPFGPLITLCLSGSPEAKRIDAAIGFPARDVDRREREPA
jgi:hypothetical protein